ncbi:caveolin-1 isoform X2 [Mustela erminea]|uniref:caveolin-1 isoform X2 n=1 Tax=Mustela erminea TaxID=36723 RepID=UPI001387251E|nr:caveolin-1 isoform X2 [Mustela erminea]
MSGGKYVDSEGHLYTVPIREQGNIYKPNNKAMAEEMNEKQVYDAHTKEIDLVNRDPKHLNDDVVKGSSDATKILRRNKRTEIRDEETPSSLAEEGLLCLENLLEELKEHGMTVVFRCARILRDLQEKYCLDTITIQDKGKGERAVPFV